MANDTLWPRILKALPFLLILFLLPLFITGCAKNMGHMEKSQAYPQEDYGMEADSYEDAFELDGDYSVAAARSSSGSIHKRKTSKSASLHAMKESSPQAPAPQGEGLDTQEQTRLMYYNAYLQLQIRDLERSMAQASAIAVKSGGFVERLGGTSMTLRIPVSEFDRSLSALSSLGEVLRRNISAQDITDSFQDATLRLKTYTATRDRLVLLLAKTESDEEKIRLLLEIQNLTDKIEALTVKTNTLRDLASFSRVTLDFSLRSGPVAGGGMPKLAAFHWITQLSPFLPQPPSGKTLEPGTPSGLVALNLRGIGAPFVAEGPGGTVFWATRLKNQPRGDVEFWSRALREGLSDGFSEVKTKQVGPYTLLTFIEDGDTPYTWHLALIVSDKHIELVHIYFPSPEAETRHWPAIQALLEGHSEVQS